MAVRSLALTALFAGMLAAAGCVPKEDAPEAVGPPAPKTVAELLVGKWKQVSKRAGRLDGFELTEDFRSDGTVTLWVNDPGMHLPQPQITLGTYRLEGNLLFLNLGRREGEIKITIDEITDDKLVYSGWVGRERQVEAYERVR